MAIVTFSSPTLHRDVTVYATALPSISFEARLLT
jgi:hypothetical protein